MKIKKDRKQKFIENCAKGEAAYRAAINAGYSEKYAKVFASKLLEKYKNEIEKLKPIAQETIKNEFKYEVKTSFDKLNEIQKLALLKDRKGNYNNLIAAIRAEELKGKMYGVYEADNLQQGLTIKFNRDYD